MEGPIGTFWAKLGTDSGGNTRWDDADAPSEWHPLLDHCADVAATLRALLDRPLIHGWLAALAGWESLDVVHRDRLAFLAALHDVGKVNLGFQNKRFQRPPFSAGHVGPMLQLLDPLCPLRRRMFEALTLPDLAFWATDPNTFFDLFRTTISHHGRPIRPEPYFDPRCWQPAGDLDPFVGASALRQEAERWLPGAFADATPFPARAEFQHGFNGLLTLADWIASDPAHFPFSEQQDGERFTWAHQWSRIVLDRLGLDTDATRQTLGRTPPTFSAVSEHSPPRELQARVLDLPTTGRGSVTVLEAETGSGKTEAALARFLRLFQAEAVDGLYFALPTRTAATQMHARVRTAMKLAFPDAESRPPVVLAVPGYLRVDELEGQRLDRFVVRWGDDSAADRGDMGLAPSNHRWSDDDHERRSWRGWAAETSKRFLAGAVVVGTVDQVLLSALAVSHSHLRAAALVRHLLVVDEVHASDAYMTAILEAVLARHVGAGGHALLMSATLGAAARDRLLAAGRSLVISSMAEAQAAPYPLITHASPPDSAPVLLPIAGTCKKTIRVELAPIAGEPASIALRAIDAARLGARVLVIRNTVRDCVATQEALEALAEEPSGSVKGERQTLLFGLAGVPAPHHARFAREDREALDTEIQARFGINARGGGCVAVATQTVQQSLDLDSDLLLTDLCPMDVLLQRLGRLFRHERKRPAGFKCPRTVVLVPEERDLARSIRRRGEPSGPHGIGKVYADLRVLEATWQQLEQQPVLEIPRMNRALVEATTHPDALEMITSGRQGLWTEHEQWVLGTLLAHVRVAGLHLARWDLPFPHPDALFPDKSVRIGTRLGAEDRVAEFEGSPPGPFGDAIRRLSLPHWMVHGAEQEAYPEEVEASGGTITFRFGQRRYRYDRHGLRLMAQIPIDAEEDDA